jgi:hypothetical protein
MLSPALQTVRSAGRIHIPGCSTVNVQAEGPAGIERTKPCLTAPGNNLEYYAERMRMHSREHVVGLLSLTIWRRVLHSHALLLVSISAPLWSIIPQSLPPDRFKLWSTQAPREISQNVPKSPSHMVATGIDGPHLERSAVVIVIPTPQLASCFFTATNCATLSRQLPDRRLPGKP